MMPGLLECQGRWLRIDRCSFGKLPRICGRGCESAMGDSTYGSVTSIPGRGT
jgi:hypothetical protein